jgi:UDP-N-acetylmuramyl tripeptide synthase
MAITETDGPQTLLKALEAVRPAFGRGEAIEVDGHPLEIVLVKNPAGFRLALQSYAHKNISTMIAINDNYADGRDMSWLWDVNFTALKHVETVSGTRAYDMALRLQYDDITIETVDTNLATALHSFIEHGKGKKRIFCTYTAMMSIRKLLAKTYDIEDID